MPKEKILIVEDERIVAEEMRQTLQKMGFTVTGVVSKGQDAIKAVSENPPDLILMDIRLKGEMDGITAAGVIMEKFSIPVIYLTAYSDDETIQRAKMTKPLGYILKPLDISLFRAIVDRRVVMRQFKLESTA